MIVIVYYKPHGAYTVLFLALFFSSKMFVLTLLVVAMVSVLILLIHIGLHYGHTASLDWSFALSVEIASEKHHIWCSTYLKDIYIYSCVDFSIFCIT